jgi:glycosyltransferase involved in cell wall biosynthesis
MPARRAAQVVTIHDLYFLAHPERTNAEIRRDYPALVRRHAHRAARIIVPSRFTAGEVERRLDVDPARIAMCPPGAPEWTPRESLNREGYILFFSTLEPRKNVSGLLDAYERLVGQDPRFRPGRSSQAADRHVPELVLAGKTTDEARPWLDRLKRTPLAGHVRHIGYVEPEDRQALYSGARLLVMPSFEEGFGIPVLEAMSFGVPVVAAARGALPEVLGDAGPLVNPDDPVAIAAAMARVLEEDGYAAACREKGIARARQFNWDRTAQLIADVYASAASNRGTGPHDTGERTIDDRAIGDSRADGRRRSAMGD